MLDLLSKLIHNIPVMVVLAFILLLAGAFVWFYLRRSLQLSKSIRVAREKLRGIPDAPDADLTAAFEHDADLKHLWSEYLHTLHKQTEPDPASGMVRTVACRATVPAEVFFSPATIVDGRISVEFFRHLPGIFTGLGIIGTFVGLITGLQNFKLRQDASTSIDPAAAVGSLELLINGVGEAFFVSAFAIILAMLVTLGEKLLLQRLYLAVEDLVREIDRRFDSGASEEYLARLTRAAEESASQSKILKDALVGELRDILTTLTERQVQAFESSHLALKTTFQEQIEQGLQAPLKQIAAGFSEQRDQQGQQVSQLLGDLLATFTERIQNLFGDQVHGINEMQRKTVEALTASMQRFEDLARAIETSGSKAGDAMADQLSKAIDAMESRQASINEAMSSFVAEMKRNLSESQTESAATTNRLMSDMSTSMQALVASMNEASRRSAEEQAERQRQLSDQASQGMEALAASVSSQIGGMSQAVETLIKGFEASGNRAAADAESRQKVLSEQATAGVEALKTAIDAQQQQAMSAVEAMRNAVEQLRSVSLQAIDGMNRGAGTMHQAALKFTDAGEAVSQTLEGAGQLGRTLEAAGAKVTVASEALESLLADYRSARDAMSALIPQLAQAVDAAKREVGMTRDVLATIERSAEALKSAGGEANEYLDDVVNVLTESFSEFEAGILKTIRESNKAYQGELSSAVGRLTEVIGELDGALDDLVTSASRKR